jgi:hypothetical protein
MNNLEKFIRDNREDFDAYQPSSDVWNNLEKEFGTATPGGVVRSMQWRKWAAAAAVLFFISTGVYFLLKEKTVVISDPVANKTKASTDTPAKAANPEVDLAGIDPEYAKEVTQFNKLIEARYTELKKVEKEEPVLYSQFAGDIQKLEASYKALRSQLPVNPNKEMLLQAMIQNLQLQIDLLNQQLNIIHQINQSKKSRDEKTNTKI